MKKSSEWRDMKAFENIDVDKQIKIENSAMMIFANNGYKKAYMSEIAETANISKATLFYYFGTKKSLYQYIAQLASKKVIDNVSQFTNCENVDFFDYMQQVSEVKMNVLKKSPYLMHFLTTFYLDEDSTATLIRNEILAANEHRQQFDINSLDLTNFKDSVDPLMVFDLLQKWTEGYISKLDKQLHLMSDEMIVDYYDQLMVDFNDLLVLLKSNFYQ